MLWDRIDNCRIKTEKEFINQYGTNWRSKTKYYFVEEMDYLLGKDYSVGNVKLYEDYGDRIIYECYSLNQIEGDYFITDDMLNFKE